MNIKAFLDEPLMQRQPGHSAGSRTLRDMSQSPKSLIFFAVVLVAGVLGGTAAYQAVQASSPAPGPRESLVVDSSDDVADQGATKKLRDDGRSGFAPCREPARLEGDTCVTDVVRTVTLPGASAAAPPAPPTSSSQSGHSHHHSGDDDHGHHGGDGEDGHHHGGDDDDDDHSGHGHGGDDDHDGDDDHHGEDD